MRFSAIVRKSHRWTSLVIAVPLLAMVGTGLLLQLKKHWSWVQPEEARGTGTVPVIDMAGILASVAGVAELGVTGWHDINRIDVRPDRGMAKVRLRNDWEVQVDLGTGRVLKTEFRRSDAIESLHDGSYFAGDWTKLGVFMPAGVGLMGLLVTGLWMFWRPFIVRRWRGRKAARGP